MQYYVKAAYAGAAAFLTSLGTALAQIGDGAAFGDIKTLGWVLIAGGTLAAVGGVLGLQSLPAGVSTSIKP